MQNINIKDLESIKEELEKLEDDDVIFVNDEQGPKYALISIDNYDDLESYRGLIEDAEDSMANASVKIISNKQNNLTYDEYEKIKKQLVEVFDKTFKPNPNKLN